MKLLIKDSLTKNEKRKLMDIYLQSNKENIKNFYPKLNNDVLGLKQIEEDFCNYLENEFFKINGNKCYVLVLNDNWISALRLSKLDNFYWIEALETNPEYRNKGYAQKLLLKTINYLKREGNFIIKDEVYINNIVSLNTHLKCNFQIEFKDEEKYILKYTYRK